MKPKQMRTLRVLLVGTDDRGCEVFSRQRSLELTTDEQRHRAVVWSDRVLEFVLRHVTEGQGNPLTTRSLPAHEKQESAHGNG